MPHFGSKAKSESVIDWLVVMGTPWVA